METKEFYEIEDKVTAHRSIHKRIIGTHAGGLLLSQLLYWSKVMKHKEFYKTDIELRKELDMGKKQFYNSKKKVMASGVFSQQVKGLPPMTYYKANLDVLGRLIPDGSKGGKGEINIPKKGRTIYPKRGELFTQKGENIYSTENTTEITHKITTKENKKKVFFVETPGATRAASAIDLSVDNCFSEFDFKENVFEGTVIEDSNKRAKRSERNLIEEQFKIFWSNYPVKVGKGAAQLSYHRAVKKTSPASILSALTRQLEARETSIRLGVWIPPNKHPSTWLNQQCWEDEVKGEEQIRQEGAIQMRQKMSFSQMKQIHVEEDVSPEFKKMREESLREMEEISRKYEESRNAKRLSCQEPEESYQDREEDFYE